MAQLKAMARAFALRDAHNLLEQLTVYLTANAAGWSREGSEGARRLARQLEARARGVEDKATKVTKRRMTREEAEELRRLGNEGLREALKKSGFK